MLRRIPRFLRVSVVLAVIAAVALSVFQSWSSSTPGTGGWTQTQWGPLGPADRDLIVRVRQAGLWEQPTGQQAVQMASSPEVKEIGRHISEEHATLDDETRKIADQLGVLLPTSPSAQQQAWMTEISEQTGSEFDRVFVQRLREAHGTVLGLLAQVRAGTRNALVRSFADTGEQFVRRHIGYLEGTGLVNYAALPAPPAPGLLAGAPSGTDLIVPVLVVVAALLAAVGLVVAVRRRPAPSARSAPPVTHAPPMPEPTLLALPGPRAVPPPPGETTGSRRALRPTEATGPRHAIRPRARL